MMKSKAKTPFQRNLHTVQSWLLIVLLGMLPGCDGCSVLGITPSPRPDTTTRFTFVNNTSSPLDVVSTDVTGVGSFYDYGGNIDLTAIQPGSSGSKTYTVPTSAGFDEGAGMGNLAGDFELGNPPVVNLPLPSIFLSNGVNHTFYISGDALATPPTVMISETPPGGGGGGRRAK